MAPSSIPSDNSSDDGSFVALAPATIIQMISIRRHVPVTLDMDEGNYGQWRLFFDLTLGKFGLESHIRLPTPSDERNGE